VLHITSYNDAANEAFPSVLITANLPAGNGALTGQPLQAQAYVQAVKDGPVWHSADDAPVEVRIDQAAEGKIAGTITAGSLVSSDDGKSIPVTGSFTGSMP
jgi:hypothetical protein